ncbi:ABC transporter permease [Lachnoclostridium sp.]|uniref:ABC transporter permease n=1 Tax=Lachnoclostridium sp. TaxID=2028282 RepID=UPI00289728F6|nr:ABC transporter permease subunit [Lachnoclostridium sp.]
MKAKSRKNLTRIPFYIIMFTFILFVVGIFATVVIGCFSNDWSKTFLPKSFSTFYLKQAWTNYGIAKYYLVSVEIVVVATSLSLICVIPTAYVMARKEMKIKSLLHQFFQLPILLPELLIGIPLATIFYSIGIAESYGVVVAILIVIGIPFGLSILIPFIEALDERVEIAAETLGANKFKVFTKIIIPQLIPGVVSTLINVFVRLFTNYTLVLLVGGPKTFTLTIKVFNVLSNAKTEPQALLNSLTLYYMLPMLIFTFLTLVLEKMLKKRFGGK